MSQNIKNKQMKDYTCMATKMIKAIKDFGELTTTKETDSWMASKTGGIKTKRTKKDDSVGERFK